MKKAPEYVMSSGNIFADIGLPNPEEAAAKAELAHRISRSIRRTSVSVTPGISGCATRTFTVCAAVSPMT